MNWPAKTILEQFLNAEIKHDLGTCVHCQKILSDAEVAKEFLRQERTNNDDLTFFAAACNLAWQNRTNPEQRSLV